ncbi:MAG: hypothetical protein FJZ90_18610, partial [Chloroflexi bacterium]|nr:hypothetical protein [Chloroflexota bacterium]
TTALPVPDESFALRFDRYPTSAEIALFLEQLEAAYPALVEATTAGYSWEGRPLTAVRLGNKASGDPDQRPALYLDGQHHAREAIGAQAALYFLWRLASQYGSDALITRLLDTRTVYAIPCANPDGNDVFVLPDQRQRKNANPTATDDDRDGLYDEDGRENAGYGTYELYRYEFAAAWLEAHPDDPLVGDWFRHVTERRELGLFTAEGEPIPQIDDDGDGLYGEDPPGGVDPNRNYDSHWALASGNPLAHDYRGVAPFSEPETRAVRDYVVARPNIVAGLSYHSGTDLLLHPWAWSGSAALPDRFWYAMLSRKASQLTEANGFRGTAHGWAARALYQAGGSTLDWLCDQGILAWSPEAYGASTVSSATRITSTNAFTVALSVGEAFNPPPDEIPLSADRWLRWNLYLLAAAPNVGVSRIAATAEGLRVAVANDGLLPLDVQVSASGSEVFTQTLMTYLSAAERAWMLPLAMDPLTQTVALTLTAAMGAGSLARVQEEALALEVSSAGLLVAEGEQEPFMELGSAFGGWFAGREWDTATYHLGPALLEETHFPLIARGGTLVAK